MARSEKCAKRSPGTNQVSNLGQNMASAIWKEAFYYESKILIGPSAFVFLLEKKFL